MSASSLLTAKKKTVKKQKLTKAEKARVKLEKETDALRKSGQPFMYFLDRTKTWLAKHQNKALELFHHLDDTGEGAVSYDEFKSVMFDLNLPCNAVETHLLCQLLDQDRVEEIEYLNMLESLKYIGKRELLYTEEDIRPGLELTDRKLLHCPNSKVALWDGEPYRHKHPRYIRVLFRLKTFDNFDGHNGHFITLVHSHITVYGLIQHIIEQTHLNSTKVAIFTDQSCDAEAILPPDVSLEECGFKGGPRDNPQDLLLYYDYKAEFVDCPILKCDHFVRD